MTDDDMIEEVLLRARQAKEHAEWEDITPVLICERMGDKPVEIIVLGIPHELVASAITEMVTSSPCERVYVVNDVYASKSTGAPPSSLPMSQRWEQGDREGITEALTVLAVSPDGACVLTQPYDAILRLWEEPHPVAPAEGPLAEFVMNVYRASRARLQ